MYDKRLDYLTEAEIKAIDADYSESEREVLMLHREADEMIGNERLSFAIRMDESRRKCVDEYYDGLLGGHND